MYYNFPKDYLIPVINNYINKDSSEKDYDIFE